MEDRSVQCTVRSVKDMASKNGAWQLVSPLETGIPTFANWPMGPRDNQTLFCLKQGDRILVTLRESDYGGEKRWKAIQLEYAPQSTPPESAPEAASIAPPSESPFPDGSKDLIIAREVAVKAVAALMAAGVIQATPDMPLEKNAQGWLDWFTTYILRG